MTLAAPSVRVKRGEELSLDPVNINVSFKSHMWEENYAKGKSETGMRDGNLDFYKLIRVVSFKKLVT